MNLGELALVCFAYGAMNYDDALGQFERRVAGDIDLSQEEHRLAMLHWLNQSQHRQFSLGHHELASRELLDWHTEFDSTLPPKRAHLWEIPGFTLEEYERVFDSLAKRRASYRQNDGRRLAVSFGPTAAAKILFALRPKVFVAWDEPLRAGLRYDGSGRSYADFLLRLREELLDLQEQCRAVKLRLEDLPEAIGRPLSTPAQLLDEYYWATVTREVVAPSRQQVARWLEWYAAGVGSASDSVDSGRTGDDTPASGGEPTPQTVPPPLDE